MFIHSYFDLAGTFKKDWTDLEILDEPMFFNSSVEYAYLNGSSITRNFLDSLPPSWKGQDVVFDSRVHMLMKGWYPCIPGWHHDDVPRSTPNKQPNYINPEYKSKHILGLVNADIAPTEFASGCCELTVPENNIYKEWHDIIENCVMTGDFALSKAQSGVLYQFDWLTFHQGTKAVKNGWRWFGRVSKNTDRSNNITNMIRKQVQVYLERPMEGW